MNRLRAHISAVNRHQWRWLAALAAILWAGPCWPQATGTNPPVGSVWTYMGPTYGAAWVYSPQGIQSPTGHWAINQGAVLVRGGDRLFVGKNTNVNDGNLPCSSCDWLEHIITPTTTMAQIASLSQNGGIGIMGAIRTSDQTYSPADGEAIAGYCINDRTAGPNNNCWAGYFQAQRQAGVNSGNQIIGVEIETVENNSGVAPAHNPYIGFSGPTSIALGLGSGGGTATTYPSTVALSIGANSATFMTGIQFGATGLYGDDGIHFGTGEAIAMGKGQVINWYAYDASNCPPCGFVDAWIRMDSTAHADPIGLGFTDGTLTLGGTTETIYQITSGAANQGVIIELSDDGTIKYQIGKDGSNNFYIYDQANSKNILQSNPTNQQVTIGEGASSIVMNATATAFPAGGAPTTPVAGYFDIYMDVADNKLKAKGPGGTITILASP
jgi:hypothetical protein